MDLELNKQAGGPGCLSVPRAGITNTYRHNQLSFMWFLGLNSDPQKYFTDRAISPAPPCFIDGHTTVVKHSLCPQDTPARQGLPQKPQVTYTSASVSVVLWEQRAWSTFSHPASLLLASPTRGRTAVSSEGSDHTLKEVRKMLELTAGAQRPHWGCVFKARNRTSGLFLELPTSLSLAACASGWG